MTSLRASLRPRWHGLAAGAAIGLALGLLYGWVIRPVEYYDTSPDSLRADYRTDYVLMVAESYQGDGDLERAVQRLASLGPRPAHETVTLALEYAVSQDFPRQDLQRIAILADDLRALAPTAEIGGP